MRELLIRHRSIFEAPTLQQDHRLAQALSYSVKSVEPRGRLSLLLWGCTLAGPTRRQDLVKGVCYM